MLDGLEKENEANRKIIEGIENADTNVTDPPLQIDTETEPLLNKISTQIKDLQDRLNNITDIMPIDISKHVSINGSKDDITSDTIRRNFLREKYAYYLKSCFPRTR